MNEVHVLATSASGLPRAALSQSMIIGPRAVIRMFVGWKSWWQSTSPSGSPSSASHAARHNSSSGVC
jgi:hypothetical protein